jgi:RNA polymerase sigma-70 factor (ECF subfamily)
MADRIKYTDANCWNGLKQDDPLALGYLYDSYVDRLFISAMYVTQDREMAKDALQEVFIELWNYRKSVSEVEKPLAYLTTILKRILYKKQRALARRTLAVPASAIKFCAESIEEQIICSDEQNERHSRLHNAVSSLTARQKLILDLRFNQGLTYEQIADKLGMNYQSVNNLAFRTFRRLRGAMSPLVILFLELF